MTIFLTITINDENLNHTGSHKQILNDITKINHIFSECIFLGIHKGILKNPSEDVSAGDAGIVALPDGSVNPCEVWDGCRVPLRSHLGCSLEPH